MQPHCYIVAAYDDVMKGFSVAAYLLLLLLYTLILYR